MYFPEWLKTIEMEQDLPFLETCTARDGETLSYRKYSSTYNNKVIICLHGSSSHGAYLHHIARYLSEEVGTVFVPNLRGHFGSGAIRGDCAYVGQLEDDIADLIKAFSLQDKELFLVGHSSGGGLAIRLAGSFYAKYFQGYVLLAPTILGTSIMKKDQKWADVSLFKSISLSILNGFGIRRLNHTSVIGFNMPKEFRDGTETLSYTFNLNSSYHPRLPGYKNDIKGMNDRYILIVGEDDELMNAYAYQDILNKEQIAIIKGEKHLTLTENQMVMKRIADWIRGEEKMDVIQAISAKGLQESTIDEELENFDQLFVGEPHEIEENLRKLLPRAKFYHNRSLYPQILSQIALAQAMQKQFGEAHVTIDEAEQVLVANDFVAKARILLEKGRIYHQKGDLEGAKPFYESSYQLSQEKELDEHACNAAHMLAIVAEENGEKIEWNELAIRLAKESTNVKAKGWLGSLCNNLGVAYFDAKRYEQALVLFQESLEHRKKEEVPFNIYMAKWQIGRTLRLLGQYEEAFSTLVETQQYAEELEKNGTFSNEAKDFFQGYVYSELAEIYLLKGDANGSKNYAKLGFEKLSTLEWVVQSEPERIARLKELVG